MQRQELNRLWKLISDASPKGVWLELNMLEQWAQEAAERHGGVPAEHLARSFPWAARRLNWQAKAAPAQHGPGRAWPEAKEAEAVASAAMAELLKPHEAPSPPAPEAPARRGQGTPLAELQRPVPQPQPRGLSPEALPAPRRSPSLAERQREARRKGQVEEAIAMAQEKAGGPAPWTQAPHGHLGQAWWDQAEAEERAPALWADEAGGLLPEWAQVLGVHEHPVQSARAIAAERDQGLWTTAHRSEGPVSWGGPEGRGDRLRAPSQPIPRPVGQARPAQGPTVADLLAQGPEAWPEPEAAELPWPWGGDRPAPGEGPRFEPRPWPKAWGLGALAKLPPEYAAAGAMLGLATAVMVVWA